MLEIESFNTFKTMPRKTFNEIKSNLVRGIRLGRRNAKRPVVLAMIGVSGAGLSSIAHELSRRLHWPVIEKNKIRVRLREEGPGFTASTTDRVHDAMLDYILAERGNVILDSDFAERVKRKNLERLARHHSAKVVYLQVMCALETMIQRILRVKYNPKTHIFKNVAVAVREHTRRLPWHYRWSEAKGGQYFLRRPPVKVLAAIDTTDPDVWKKRLRILAKRLRRM